MLRSRHSRIALLSAILALVVIGVGLLLADHTTGRRLALILGLVSALLAFLLSLAASRLPTLTIVRLAAALDRCAAGDFNTRLLSTQSDDLQHLAQAFNRMAEQQANRIDALTQEQQRLAAVVEYLPIGVLITDEAGWVRHINPAAATFLATSRSEAMGQPFAHAVRHHRLIELWQHHQEKPLEPIQETVDLERQGVTLRVILPPASKDRPQGCLIILEDLTKVRLLETVRRDFIGNLSHELRTPLASLKALVDTLRDGAMEDPPAATRFLDLIENEVDAMAQMIQEMLELSRIESGQVPLNLLPTSIGEIVRPAVERLRAQSERFGLQLTVNLPDNLPTVRADPERLHQVVTNLVHNALKFTPPGGEIDISAGTKQDEVVVMVRDSGVGIPANALPRIFERFFKADRARTRGAGTGLGLSIAKHLIQAHGGRIWVESVEGEGSTFYFSLPAFVPETFTNS